MSKAKIYLDTSVINFLFHDDTPEKQAATVDFFENYIKTGVYETYVSQFVIQEINQTQSEEKRNKLLKALTENFIEVLTISDYNEIENFANALLKEGILPPSKLFDALHIAVCVVYEIDYLASWNYKHLANVNKERKVLSLAYKMNYLRSIRIITPLELMSHEE